MIQRFKQALALSFVVVGAAAAISCGKTGNHYLYATVPATNQLAVFREDPYSGVLTQLSTSPYTVGSSASSVVIHPSGKYLYVANAGGTENDISLFDINSDGTVSEVSPRTSSGTTPFFLAMDPGGAFLYCANSSSNSISVFSIDSGSGKLSAVTGSPFGINLSPSGMVLSPKGDYLYVSGSQSNFGLIVSYSISSGTLVRVGLTETSDSNPSGLAITPMARSFTQLTPAQPLVQSRFTARRAGYCHQCPGLPCKIPARARLLSSLTRLARISTSLTRDQTQCLSTPSHPVPASRSPSRLRHLGLRLSPAF